ncbi:putative serine/threonine-protein kinase PkwA [Thermoflexales bacterium]|nr:putative serine/threonine-protein kinase PkwA [Thermoflexales bacterium]
MQNNPYIGPRPFERADGSNFFGRTRETRDLLSLIMAERVVLFYAQSGAGKTSLLNTQIIPALENEGFFVLPVARVGSDLPPGLREKTVKNIFVFSVWMGLMGKETPLSTLTGTTLSAAINSWKAQAPPDEDGDPRPPILILDQFEEILTTHRDRWQDARGFFEQLAQALDKNSKLGVVLAMREDHVAGLDPYAALLPRRLKARFRMEQLKADGALEAVKQPAQNAGHPFAEGVAEKLVDDLRRVRVVKVAGEQEQDQSVLGPYIEPVQLQVVCRRLWENLPDRQIGNPITAEDVEQFGNVDRALTDFYEGTLHQVLDQAKPLGEGQGWKVRESQLRRWFGKQLITPMQTRGLVMRGSTETGGLPNPVVDLLETHHLIRADVRAGARWYEISHDRLVEPILRSNADWEQTGQSPLHRAAQRWLDSGKNPDLLYRGEVLRKGLEFAEANREAVEPIDLEFLEAGQKARAAAEKELRQHILIRRLAVGAIITMILAIVAGIFGYLERDRANEQARVADEQRDAAREQRNEALSARLEADKQRNEAYAQRLEAEKQRAEAERLGLLAVVRQLISQASEFAMTYPQRSLLLALEALRVNNNTDATLARAAESQLRRVLVEAGGLVLKRYSHRLNQVVFSPQDKWLMTISEDGQADLWDVSSGDIPTTSLALPRHGIVRFAAFNATAEWAATGTADGQIFLWDLTTRDPAANPIQLEQHNGSVRALQFSPVGEVLVSAGADGVTRVWDLNEEAAATAQPIELRNHQGTINALAVSADGTQLATGGRDNTIYLYDLEDLTQPPLKLTGHTDQVFTLDFDPQGLYLASGSIDATARLWDLTEDDPVATALVLPGHEEQVWKVTFSPNGNWLATSSVDSTTRLWDLYAEDLEDFPIVLRGHSDQVWAAAFSPDSRWLFTASRDGWIQAWDLDVPDPTAELAHHILRGHEGPIQTLAVSPNGRWLASGSDDATAQLWGINTPQAPTAPSVLRGHSSVVRGAVVDPDQHWLATFSGDGTVRLWDIAAREPGATSVVLPSHQQAIYQAALSSNGRWLATASQDYTSRLWDLKSPTGMFTSTVLRGHTSALRDVAFTPDNQRLITAGRDGTARVWDLTQADPSQNPIVLTGHRDQIRIIDISGNSRWLISGGDDRVPRLWDLSASHISSSSLPLQGNVGVVRAVGFSPDNRWVAVGGDDHIVRVWDLRATDPTTPVIPLKWNSMGVIRALQFTPDGKWLAAAGDEGAVLLWNVATLTATTPSPTFILWDHEGSVRDIDISADGQWLFSGSEDGTARLWDLTAFDPGAYSVVFPGHAGPVWGVTISPDHQWFVTASQDANARLWQPVALNDVILYACRTAGRNLSKEEWEYYVGIDLADYHRTCSEFPKGADVP